MKAKTKIALICLLILCLVAIVYALTVQRNLTNTVNVTGSTDFQIYIDSSCSTPVTSLTWDMTKGSSVTKTIYLKNIGDVKLYISWFLSSSNLPSGYTLTLTWNGIDWASGSPQDCNVQTTPYKIDITLSVPTTGSYSFIITFNGST